MSAAPIHSDSQSPENGSGVGSAGTSMTLLARIRDRDGSAWDRLVTLYAPMVYHWCRRARLQEHDAEDVFQEVFESVLKHIQGFSKENARDSFRSWLFTITRNKIRDHFRRAAREPRGEGGTEALRRFSQLEAPPDCSEGLLDTETPSNRTGLEELEDGSDIERDLYLRALGMIEGEFREQSWKAFWRTAVDEQPAPAVAEELGMTAGAVRVAKSRVLRRLREEIGDSWA